MLQDQIQQCRRARLLQHILMDMPEYPIYRDTSNCYVIYIGGEPRLFASEQAARLGQLAARAEWLRGNDRSGRPAYDA